MALTAPILDTWSALSHKRNVEPNASPQGLAPTWVGVQHRRRLNAYALLWAYRKNVVRFWLRDDDPDRVAEHREYGDADLLIQTIRAAVLGQDVMLSVAGADGDTPPEPTEADVVEGGPTLEELLADHAAEVAEIEARVERQEWIDAWAKSERFIRKLTETENNAVTLGDGIYELVWSNRKKRVRLRTYDPGFFFPVDDEDDDEEFPSKVHLAWEIERTDPQGRRVTWVRRVTYELVERVTVGLSATERYPYQAADEEPSTMVCVMTDAEWRFDALGDRHVETFSTENATVRNNADGVPLDRYPLGIDFVPVVHITNTVNDSEGWGESSMARIAQILDDLQNTDTDLAISATTTAAPPITISGSAKSGDIATYGPGQVFYTGDGRMDMLDTAASLDALLKFQAQLLERLSVNRQLPASLLGRIKPSEVPSGIALLLSFGPFRQMIEDARLAREEKYELLPKFVQRLAIVGQQLEGPVLDAGLSFGSFLPQDLDAIKSLVIDLVKAHLLSRATGVAMLQEAGIPIESIQDELDAIQAEDYEGAGALADATNDDDLAREYLGYDVDQAPAPDPGALPPGLVPGGFPIPGDGLPLEPAPPVDPATAEGQV